MAEKYIINFINGGKIKTLSVPKKLVYTVFFLCFVSVSVSLFFVYDYVSVKSSDSHLKHAKNELERKNKLIQAQRSRLHSFAEELNSIRDHLVQIDKLEDKIRIIADLDQKKGSSGEKSVFGIGGVMPEPLDSRIGLDESHSSLVRGINDRVDTFKNASDEKAQSLSDLLTSLEAKRNLLASTPSIRPVKGWLTSGFGYRDSPFTGKKEFHEGYDIANRHGTAIIAPADGTVSDVSRRGLLGKAVMIDHGHGTITKYGHLSKYNVKKGQKVKRGDKIAEMGNTGRSTGPHLHYAIFVNGRPVNPQKYILD
ncbi:MAG: M23 family metallopeptidase [Thermodesulfobacteriota bacterium]